MARELLGQRVTRVMRAVGVERVVAGLGIPCGCAKRAAALDRLDAAIRNRIRRQR